MIGFSFFYIGEMKNEDICYLVSMKGLLILLVLSKTHCGGIDPP